MDAERMNDTLIQCRSVCKDYDMGGEVIHALQDVSLTINRGEYKITGFRNRDLREHLYGPTNDPAEQKRLAGKVTRQFRLLRAHGLIKKIPKTHRYQLTQSGNQIINAILNAQNANIKNLGKTAA